MDFWDSMTHKNKLFLKSSKSVDAEIFFLLEIYESHRIDERVRAAKGTV